ncbi:MAG: hypothetical protein RIC06_20895 [Cyclobacteriaceae bacterium]
MKELSIEKMQILKGGADCNTSVGFGLGLGVTAVIAGVATGGVGLLVIGGLALYGTAWGSLYCAMSYS